MSKSLGGVIMSSRRWTILAIIWVISLVAVAAVASAQARFWKPVPVPRVLSGDDVGFRVEGFRGEVPSGTIVIRVNGNWVEAEIGGPPEGLVR
jgi:hypothetical protein